MDDTGNTYRAVTRQISVSVQPFYLEDESNPEENRYFWGYQIQIENLGAETVQLESRHWVITDALGQVHEVRGEGVVGEQPVLGPGEVFEYTSGAPLKTPSGIMVGSFQMRKKDGTHFNVEVPAFSLDSPHSNLMIN
ncbi:Co2+/Mg2+ efflux protein ApaG [Luteithermobacter gelatinilyticus]|uniref:Co2+/Mg2+ efflux protein ApaG n=1 Tax=Luteithermobacter gelatinilyticus TaxID=2582913 RepID=UPI0011062EED|nr:Co2+/Mg2+ efflux protein ApaG [Luteithermobacter gelatinilyticus]